MSRNKCYPEKFYCSAVTIGCVMGLATISAWGVYIDDLTSARPVSFDSFFDTTGTGVATPGTAPVAITSDDTTTNLAQPNGGNNQEVKTPLETTPQELALKQQNERLEADYAAGIAALKARNWARAILVLENVVAVDRNYRDARKRLSEAQNGLERESKGSGVARYYAEGVTAMNKNNFGAALAAFEKVRKINPDYREVATLIAQLESIMPKDSASSADPETAASVTARADLDSLYQEAAAASERRDWIQAIVNFEKVQLLQANYRDVVDRLAQARANVTLAVQSGNKAATAADSKVPFYVGGTVALIAGPLLGLFLFSPMARARLHLIRGDYPAAMQIYENLLRRHPARVKLYPVLANLYLLQGRRDENAMKIYRTILQLNLATNDHDEINNIVAQNYLTEGRTDSDAIAVLESALQAEQRRQQSR